MNFQNKRIFDLIITILIFPFWFLFLLIFTFFLFIFGHRPVFFSQIRVISINKEIRIFKFRSMNSKKVKRYLNSESIKQERKTGYTSIDPSTGVYTKIGLIMETFKLVELPEIFYVMRGDLSLVGNRPLPTYLQNQLEENFPNAKNRLLTKAGIFGVIQMAGRQNFNSEERVKLEILYSSIQFKNYSFKLDLIILIISLLKIFKYNLINNHNDIYLILNDNSFRSLGRLINIKINASKPIKKKL